RALNWLSWLYCTRCNYDSAIISANAAIDRAKEKLWIKGIISASINFGNIYHYKNNYPLSLKYYFNALHYADSINYKISLAPINNNIGNVLMDQGNYSEALKYFLKSLKIKESIGDMEGMARTFYNIGEIYEKQKNYNKAKENFDTVMILEQKCKDTVAICSCKNFLVLILLEQGDYKSALGSANNSLEFCLKCGNSSVISDAYQQLGQIQGDMGKIAEALEYYRKSVSLKQKLEDKKGIAKIENDIGSLLLSTKQYKEAKGYFQKALMIADSIGAKENIRDVYLNLVRLDSIEGNTSEAYKNYKLYVAYRDSISNEETTRKMVSEQMTFDFENQQEAEKIDNDKKAAHQRIIRNVFIGGFGFAFLFAGVFFFQRKRISRERDRSDKLLLNILPAETAEELKATGESKARNYSMVTVMFTDFKNFTRQAETMTAEELVKEINYCYKEFDKINARHNVEKIKTMGDGYMAAGGVPNENTSNPTDTIKAAMEIQNFMANMKMERQKQDKSYFEVRIGIHTGPVIAGIVGLNKFAYDIWGDTVNIAARMESSGEAGKINVSGATYNLVKDKFNCIYRGKVEAKNKGVIDMYFVETSM
ncbi:MAG TPA: adenylate/guanylate cyclase domain-containing protein, partial [Bacteroidia bacterium]|nr:adenylate/guanylate cyclase domain-containing protein [Bacteroidia bacterium]